MKQLHMSQLQTQEDEMQYPQLFKVLFRLFLLSGEKKKIVI